MHKNMILAMLALSVTVGIESPVYAKAKSIKVQINRLTENSGYITGKGTPGARVVVSRNHMTYATGKINQSGKLKLAVNDDLSANWKYQVKLSKKGYRVRTSYIVAKAAKTTNQSKSTVVTPSAGNSAVSGTSTSVATQSSSTDNNAQLQQLNDQIKSLQNQVTDATNKANTTRLSPEKQALADQYQKQIHDDNVQLDTLITDMANVKAAAQQITIDQELLTDGKDGISKNLEEATKNLTGLETQKDKGDYITDAHIDSAKIAVNEYASTLKHYDDLVQQGKSAAQLDEDLFSITVNLAQQQQQINLLTSQLKDLKNKLDNLYY